MIIQFDEIDDKRIYLPKIDHKINCPKCGEELEFQDHHRKYLSHPKVGKKDSFAYYCEKCDEYASQSFIIKNISIEIKLENIEVD